MSQFGQAQVQAEERQAMRALLQQPLLSSGEELLLVKRHQQRLREWLTRHTGWRLVVRADYARLYKSASNLDDSTRGLPSFHAHRYALLCLILAALERGERQTTLGTLADQVAALAADPELARSGFSFDLSERLQRSDLVQVVRYLLDLRVLTKVQGDEQQFVSGQGDALYTIHRSLLASMLSTRRGPSTLDLDDFEERLAQISFEPWPDSEEGRLQRIRWNLTRRLLDDPVLYTADLQPEELTYFTSQRAHMAREINLLTGLEGEQRLEGLAMVDPEEELSDLSMPETGTNGHITLLLAEHLARNPDQVHGPIALQAFTAELILRHKAHWNKQAQSPDAAEPLCAMALERLEALGLVRQEEAGWRPLPAISRYRLVEIHSPEQLLL